MIISREALNCPLCVCRVPNVLNFMYWHSSRDIRLELTASLKVSTYPPLGHRLLVPSPLDCRVPLWRRRRRRKNEREKKTKHSWWSSVTLPHFSLRNKEVRVRRGQEEWGEKIGKQSEWNHELWTPNINPRHTWWFSQGTLVYSTLSHT